MYRSIIIIIICLALLLPGMSAFSDDLKIAENEEPQFQSPSVVLIGDEELEWTCGIPFHDPGAAAYGSDGRDLTNDITVEGEVICWKVGDYELSYLLKDGKEILATATRRVHVVPAELPDTVQPSRTIYLTFDDGPCDYTELVLDTLAKYNVKATFFVVAEHSPRHLKILPRILEEGHTLGIHCYSHFLEGLYWDANSFFTDFMKAQEVIYQYTGTYAHVSRLPGGSRTAHTMAITLDGYFDEFREMMHNMGVRYYDWNVQPETYKEKDGVEYLFTHPDQDYDFAIVLQHDTRSYSVLALDRMIQWGLEQGYSFAPIDLTTPEIQFY